MKSHLYHDAVKLMNMEYPIGISNLLAMCTWILVFLYCSMYWGSHAQNNNIVKIPVEIHSVTNEVLVEYFQLDVFDTRIEFAIASFCENYQIRKSFCRAIYNIAKEKQLEKLEEIRMNTSVNKLLVSESRLESSLITGLLKHSGIINAELVEYSRQLYNQRQYSSVSYQFRENDIMKQLENIVKLSSLPTNNINRIIIIRGLTLSPCFNGGNMVSCDILQEILTTLTSTPSLMLSASRVIVLYSGYELPSSFIDLFSSFNFIHLPSDIYQSEVHSLSILSLLSRRLVELKLPSTQILFFTAIGSEFLKHYESIIDWRQLMSYYMITEHKTAFHLLASNQFDVVTVNYNQEQFCWWSTAKYMSTLPLLSLDGNNKKSWIFDSEMCRMYLIHSDIMDHRHQVYPQYCYDKKLKSSLLSVTKDQFKANCGYDLIGVVNENVSDTYNSSNVGSRQSSAVCLGLEIDCKA